MKVTGMGTHFRAAACPLNPRMLVPGVQVVSWQTQVDDLNLEIVLDIALEGPTGVNACAVLERHRGHPGRLEVPLLDAHEHQLLTLRTDEKGVSR